MFFRRAVQGLFLGTLVLNTCWGGVSVHQQRDISSEREFQIYMLRGQLYEAEQAKLVQEVAKRKSGPFVGVLLTQTLIRINGIRSAGLPLLYGLKIGYQRYVKSDIGGLRVYGEYMGGVNKSVLKPEQSSAYQIASFNVDLVMDKSIDTRKKYAIGVFGGLGVGWSGYKDYPSAVHNPNGFGLVINLGISMTLNIRHRIELALKVPPLKVSHAFAYSFASDNLYYISYNFLL
uniref:OMP1022 n=1 Tax=Helicobacter salomonis TaxID=56878 RepID=A0A1M4NIP6_9HELI|nr:outer membrane beta-barrel protein [Helicobacter salomonis]SFZ72893.1 OMP674 [Helicobacter salomonis]SFZ73026.1 OMP1022 [Helicobacter salomonis]